MPGQIVDVDVNLDFIDLSVNAPDDACSACLPGSYVDDEQMRISMYRKTASAASMEDVQALKDEFKDRFGPIPAELERLLNITALRVLAAEKNINSIETKGDKLILKRHGEYIKLNYLFPRLRSTNPDQKLNEIMRWIRK